MHKSYVICHICIERTSFVFFSSSSDQLAAPGLFCFTVALLAKSGGGGGGGGIVCIVLMLLMLFLADMMFFVGDYGHAKEMAVVVAKREKIASVPATAPAKMKPATIAESSGTSQRFGRHDAVCIMAAIVSISVALSR